MYTTYPYNASGMNFAEALKQNLAISLILMVVLIVAYWRIFQKAGEAGWKSIIPIYNAYILWKIAGLNFWKYFFIILGVAILIPVLAGVAIATGSGIIGFLIPILYIAFAIYMIVVMWKLCKNLATNFGYGTGFALGLFFLNPIFMLILAFAKNTYQAKA